jgi:hypothetical protein
MTKTVERPTGSGMEGWTDEDERAYRSARERATALQGFYTHLLVYLVVNAGLFAINAVTRGDDGSWWCIWPLLGWGVALLIHGLTTFAGVFSTDWRDRKAMQLYERDRRRPR